MKATTALILTCAAAVALAATTTYDRKKSEPKYNIVNREQTVLRRVYTPLNSTAEACQPWEDREEDPSSAAVGCRTKCPRDGKFGVTVDECRPIEYLEKSGYPKFIASRRMLVDPQAKCAADEIESERIVDAGADGKEQRRVVICLKKCPEPEYKMVLGYCVNKKEANATRTVAAQATASLIPPHN